jgi:membrane-associated protein
VHFDLVTLLITVGYSGLFGIIFAETGLLIGFFLPGDSLLFTAGFLASQGIFDIRALVLGCFIAAVTGDSVGYMFGQKVGRRLFQRPESLFFNPEHLVRANEFYRKHGAKTIVLARFLPVIRTFAPIVAGIGEMEYKTFVAFNVVGAFLWAVCLPLAGYYLGSVIPDVDRYLLPIVGAIIVLSILPQTIHVLRNEDDRRRIWSLLSRAFSRSN